MDSYKILKKIADDYKVDSQIDLDTGIIRHTFKFKKVTITTQSDIDTKGFYAFHIENLDDLLLILGMTEIIYD